MIVAVASGKGGTGKTSVTASLAAVWDRPLIAVDLDVDEPNLHLFLRPEIRERQLVTLPVPVIDLERCTRCRSCVDLCQFKAISIMGDMVMTFTEMCHGCGGCMAICPEGAISTGQRELGVLEIGAGRDMTCLTGRLRGQAESPLCVRCGPSCMNTQAETGPMCSLTRLPA